MHSFGVQIVHICCMLFEFCVREKKKKKKERKKEERRTKWKFVFDFLDFEDK